MFSQRFYKLLSRLLQISNLFVVSQLRYDKLNQVLSVNTSFIYSAAQYFKLILIFTWFVGMLIKIYTRYSKGDYSGLHVGLSTLFGCGISTYLYCINVFYPKQICQTTNGVLILFRRLHCKVYS